MKQNTVYTFSHSRGFSYSNLLHTRCKSKHPSFILRPSFVFYCTFMHSIYLLKSRITPCPALNQVIKKPPLGRFILGKILFLFTCSKTCQCIISIQSCNVGNRNFLRTNCFACTGICTGTKTFLIHLCHHIQHPCITFRMSLW